MEINITKQLHDENIKFAASIAETGCSNIGQLTWQAALESNYKYVTEENRGHFLDYFLSFGCWEKDEISSIESLNALTVQEIAHRIRELENYDSIREYEQDCEMGIIQGGIFEHFEQKGQFYIYLGY